MSASPQPDASTNDSDPKDERLANYLRSRVEDGELYFKSKFIAEDVSLSSKEIGALIVKLQVGRRSLNRTLVVHRGDHLACRADQLTALSPSTHHSFATIASSTSSILADREMKTTSYRGSFQLVWLARCLHAVVREPSRRISGIELTNNWR